MDSANGSTELSELEKKEKININRSKMQNAIIASVGTIGVLSVILLAPNAFQILKMVGLDKKIRNYRLSALSRARKKLIAGGILIQCRTSSGPALKLSPRGKEIFGRIKLENVKIKKQKLWDKKWRIVIFDISEKRKATREDLRRLLEKAGFLMIQDSVYLYPFPCNEFIALVKSHYATGKSLLYMIVDQIENDEHFKKHFNLLSD